MTITTVLTAISILTGAAAKLIEAIKKNQN